LEILSFDVEDASKLISQINSFVSEIDKEWRTIENRWNNLRDVWKDSAANSFQTCFDDLKQSNYTAMQQCEEYCRQVDKKIHEIEQLQNNSDFGNSNSAQADSQKVHTTISKKGGYVKKFREALGLLSADEKNRFEEMTKIDVEKIINSNESFYQHGLDVNHRLPPDILSSVEKKAILGEIGVHNINSPQVMDLLMYQANRGQHQTQWKDRVQAMRRQNLANSQPQDLTVKQILQVWVEIEKNVCYNYELPNSISPEKFLQKY
jgi:hypothetical protein